MKVIDMVFHEFEKQNMVTTPKGDLYKCSTCGVSGYRMGLAPSIKVTDAAYKASMRCPLLTQVKRISLGSLLNSIDDDPITEQIYKVTSSQWRTALPEGTLIKKTEPRPGYRPKQWFQRVDGQLLFPDSEDDKDGKFSLFDNEYEIAE